MTDLNARVSISPTAELLHSAGDTLHLGKHGQMPLAFLVLHASLSRYIDYPRRHARRYPCRFTNCLLANPGQDSRAVLYQERDLPIQVDAGCYECALCHRL